MSGALIATILAAGAYLFGALIVLAAPITVILFVIVRKLYLRDMPVAEDFLPDDPVAED